MTRTTTPPNANRPIVEENLSMSQEHREWTTKVTNAIEVIGTGTPEGVVEAPQYSKFVDEAIPLTPVLYMKMLPSITGDKKKGWATL